MTETGGRSSREVDFSSLLRKGMGRAAIILQQDPNDLALNEQLLNACTSDLTYDAQCEESRVDYLYRLIKMTGQATTYRVRLEARLRADGVELADMAVAQIFGLLCRLVGDSGAPEDFLEDFVLKNAQRSVAVTCAWELVRLQGLDALVACAHRFSTQISEEPWIIQSLKAELEDRDGIDVAKAALAHARRADAELDRLMSLDPQAELIREDDDVIPPYSIMKAELERGDRKSFPLRWIRMASTDDIEQVAADVLAATDSEQITAYLKVFWHRPFPGDPTALFPLLESPDRRTAHGTARLLRTVHHPAVRDRALKLIADGHPELGIELLVGSHQVGDIVAIRSLLERLVPDSETYHSVALSIVRLIEEHAEPIPEAEAILLHVYENGPCSLCRGRVVELLVKDGRVPAWMGEEGRYDAEPSIATWFCEEIPQPRAM